MAKTLWPDSAANQCSLLDTSQSNSKRWRVLELPTRYLSLDVLFIITAVEKASKSGHVLRKKNADASILKTSRRLRQQMLLTTDEYFAFLFGIPS